MTKLTVTRAQAAAILGVSLSHFKRHIQPELTLIYSGRLRLVRVTDLEAWVERSG
jgi:excisionase family DNA binding protein